MGLLNSTHFFGGKDGTFKFDSLFWREECCHGCFPWCGADESREQSRCEHRTKIVLNSLFNYDTRPVFRSIMDYSTNQG